MASYSNRVKVKRVDGTKSIVEIDGQEVKPVVNRDQFEAMPENQKEVLAGIAREMLSKARNRQ